MNIIEKIISQIEIITEEDIRSWVINDILELYKPKINYWAKKTEDCSFEKVPELSVRAFTEEVKTKLINSLITFIIKRQHWKNKKYNLNTYLLSTIKNFSKEKRWINDCAKRTTALVCPVCKLNNDKSFLIPESGLWRCSTCTENKSQIELQLKAVSGVDEKTTSTLQSKYRLYNTFSLHSRKGFRCPDCKGFIPESSIGKYGASCPYENCLYSGGLDLLEKTYHPSAATFKRNLSLNSSIGAVNNKCNDKTGTALEDKLYFKLSNDDQKPDTAIFVTETYKKEYSTLIDVINKQIDLINRSGSENTKIKKLLMYKAYKNMIEMYPEEMMTYLVHLKNNHDFPIQSKIFQEYVSLIENYLPFSFQKNSKTIDILSLTDPNLSLFLGKSTYEANIDNNFIIPNNTIETYVGKRKFKNYGPCFIGRLIDVVDNKNNRSIKNLVKEYNFVQIMVDKSVEVNTPVTVSHFRIPSHYEMGSLVFLQRIRRQIVDSVYFHLNNKKRPLKSKV